MDNYPNHLQPHGNDTFGKEGFASWWERARASFATVPRNVARQWLHRHWGRSDFGWLPSAGAQFTLEIWQPADVAALQVWREGHPPYDEWGKHLLSLAMKPPGWRYPVASIMNRHLRWPAPPIAWHRGAPIANEPWDDLPNGFILLEGNRRIAMAKALERRGTLGTNLPVWVLRYPSPR